MLERHCCETAGGTVDVRRSACRKYLSDEEQLDALKRWWSQNGTWLVVALVVGIGAVVGWRWYDAHSADQIAASSELFQSYLDAEDDDARTALAEELATAFPASTYRAFTELDAARRALEDDDVATAEAALRRVVDGADAVIVRDLARVRLARLLHGEGQTEEAVALLGLVRSPGYSGLAAEVRGDIFQAQGDRENAHAAYQAALDAVDNQAERPLLAIKLADTAPPQPETGGADAAVDAAPASPPVEESADAGVEEGADEPADTGTATGTDESADAATAEGADAGDTTATSEGSDE